MIKNAAQQFTLNRVINLSTINFLSTKISVVFKKAETEDGVDNVLAKYLAYDNIEEH